MVQVPKLIDGYRHCINELDNDVLHSELVLIVALLCTAENIYTAGNGGSSSTASHLAADLRRVGVNATCLTDNISTITALSNDYSYEEVFSKQLDSLCQRDILIVISASGNSTNIIKAIEVAKAKKSIVIAFLGFGGGKAKALVEHPIVLSSHDYGEVEGIHSCLCHILPQMIRSLRIDTAIR